MGATEALSPHARRLLVFVEVTLERECFPAAPADIRLIGGVRLNVGAQVALVRKRFGALRALKRFFASVGTDVTLQQPRPGKFLPAKRAFAPLVVCAHVHAVGRHGHVDLVAVWTLLGLLVVHGAVCLSVTREVGRRRVAFPAVGADVVIADVDFSPRFLHQLIQAIVKATDGVARAGLGAASGCDGATRCPRLELCEGGGEIRKVPGRVVPQRRGVVIRDESERVHREARL